MNVAGVIAPPHTPQSALESLEHWRNLIDTGPKLDRRTNFTAAADSLWLAAQLETNSESQRTLVAEIWRLGREHAHLQDQDIEYILVGAQARYGRGEPETGKPKLLAKNEFIGGFVPPDYLVDGVLQRRFLYGCTAATSHGKTALALLLARLVSDHHNPNPHFGAHAVDHGNVIYFAGENPDDLRMRVIADDSASGRDGSEDHVAFIAGTYLIEDMFAECERNAAKLDGKIDLIVVDTSAAFFPGDSENDNSQMGSHARTLRRLTELPGGPCVLVLCHPAKHVTEASQLQPRGGGAFIAELDGNLTLWKTDDLVDLNFNKMRGAGFESMTFRLAKITCPELVDSKGRSIPSVRAVPVSDKDQQAIAKANRSDEDLLLVAMLEPGKSVAELAVKCGWLANGMPYKSKVQRRQAALEKAGLLKKGRGGILELTDKGKAAADSATRPERTQ